MVPHEVVDIGDVGVWLSCLGCKRGAWLVERKEKQYE